MPYSSTIDTRQAVADRPATKRFDHGPPLKWAGGKRWQLAHLAAPWSRHRHRRLVEPFCGGLAVALGLRPERALLNDVNPHLINFYRWLKRGLVITMPMRNLRSHYDRRRKQFNDLLQEGRTDSADAASLFYYLNRTGYNGLCRFNASGRFNVPFGQYKRINYRTDFLDYRQVLADWELTCVAFDDLPLAPGDFVYADPPYDVDFTHYSRGGFDWEQQVRTAEWLARHPGPVILSNQATPRILDLYRSLDYKVSIVTAPRRISCTGDRTPVSEVLASRNL